MARIFTSGFEYNSTTNGEDWTTFAGLTIVSDPVRSGIYAGRSLPTLGGSSCVIAFATSDQTAPFWFRVYVRIAAAPTGVVKIILIEDTTPLEKVAILLNTDRTLQLKNDEDGVNIGSPSSALAVDTWYRVEFAIDTTTIASTTVEAKLDGTVFASGTINLATGIARLLLGEESIDLTLDCYFDDVAINDSNGSNQNSYPGSGAVIRLTPSAAGDVNTFATQVGGTAGSANNFTRIDEENPDSADYNASNTLNEEDLFNIPDSGLTVLDTINVVEVNLFAANGTADAATEIKTEIKLGGTTAQGSGIIPNSTTFAFFRAPFYANPDGISWTSIALDNLQIGYKLTTAGTNAIRAANVAAMVDYTVGVRTPSTSLLGVG